MTDHADVDLIGFHGQTVAHAPRLQGTLQVGDGGVLAEALGRPVVWDFRSDDVSMGGEGAPLAPFFHHACARYFGATEPLCFLNLGGVGNVTYVDPRKARPEDEGALLAFDTGPANAPINDFLQSRLGLAMDEGGRIASGGAVENGALELFLAEPYFARIPPKSLDRNDFPEMIGLVTELSDADATATLTAMCAAAVAQGMEHCPKAPSKVLATGGGRHNPVLMEMLRVSLDCPVEPVETVGLDGDMLEAQAFAYLAVRVARGLPTSAPSTTGVRACVGGGTVTVPEGWTARKT
jgi:anhydro-N-acetylmuramic acid kinase